MGKDERYAIYVYYGVAGEKLKPAPLLWHDPAAGYLRAYRSNSNDLAERAMDLMAQSAVGYLDDVVTAALDAAMPYGSFFDFVDEKSWLAQLKQQVKAGVSGKSIAVEIVLPDMGGAVASRTGILVSSADLGEMIGIRNIQNPAARAIAAAGLERPTRWHALCFKAFMPDAEPDLQERLTDVVAGALAGV